MALRDHEPIIIDEFNGLWDRGDYESTPMDHFQDCENIQFVGSSGFRTRDGVGISQDVNVPLENIARIYDYPTPTGNTLIVLVIDGDNGVIYHVVDSTTVYGPLLTIDGMTDFAFAPYAGRGYISPFFTYAAGDLNLQKGVEDEFLYVYAGDGTAARKAAGAGMTGTMTVANGAAGHTDAGFHLFGFVSETISGYLSPPSIITGFSTNGAFSVSFGSIPTSGDPNVTKRYLVATKVIPTYNGNTTGYQFFFVPDATINNNTSTALNNISFFDQDLLEDASYLFDNYTEIPAGASLCFYHNRLCLFATFDDISIGLISQPGEPEAFNQITGLVVVPPDGNPISNGQELRDVLYVFKRARTVSFVDNGDDPSSWPDTIVDNALGTSVHGIATVLDTGSSSVDFLIVGTYQGISLFNGRFITPELSWKIEKRWKDQDRNENGKIQIVNEPISKVLYIVLADGTMMTGNYSNGMDPMKIRWSPYTFLMPINTVAIYNIDEIILGSPLVV